MEQLMSIGIVIYMKKTHGYVVDLTSFGEP
jgi:hypothetical protein